jgi:hypothetical protein
MRSARFRIGGLQKKMCLHAGDSTVHGIDNWTALYLERAEDLFRLACPTQYNLHASFDAVRQTHTRFSKDVSGLVGVSRRPMHLIGLPSFDSCSFSAM